MRSSALLVMGAWGTRPSRPDNLVINYFTYQLCILICAVFFNIWDYLPMLQTSLVFQILNGTVRTKLAILCVFEIVINLNNSLSRWLLLGVNEHYTDGFCVDDNPALLPQVLDLTVHSRHGTTLYWPIAGNIWWP